MVGNKIAYFVAGVDVFCVIMDYSLIIGNQPELVCFGSSLIK